MTQQDERTTDGTTPLRIEGTSNLRDVGGLRAARGRVRRGVLYRSDALSFLTSDGRRAFDELDVVRVVDLRDQAELDRQPSELGDTDVEIRHVPVFSAADPLALLRSSTEDRDVGVADLYATMLATCGPRLAQAVGDLADVPSGATLVHCTAGKDRTGVVVAFVLSILGVEEDDIVADYAASERNLAGDWAEQMLLRATEMAAAHGVVLSPGMREIVTGSPAEAMRGALDLLRDEHGGVLPYLLGHGLDESAPAALERRLVER